MAQQREAEVEVERERVEQHEPIVIEMPEPVVEVSKKVEKRIERERQVPLFPRWSRRYAAAAAPAGPGAVADRPAQCRDAGIHLAPDRAEAAEFGVQVHVLAAYPGPVVTATKSSRPSA